MTPTRAEATLARAVGSSIVGFGDQHVLRRPARRSSPITTSPSASGVRLVRAPHPPDLRTSPGGPTPDSSPAPVQFPGVPFSVFCPAVTSAARWPGATASASSSRKPVRPARAVRVFDRRVGDEDLYRIPDARCRHPRPGAARRGDAARRRAARHAVLPGHSTDPASVDGVPPAPAPQLLQLRITDVPGWHATIDGRPLALQRFAGVMLQARIPPGRHVVELATGPSPSRVGIAARPPVAVAALATARRRGMGGPTPAPRSTAPVVPTVPT